MKSIPLIILGCALNPTAFGAEEIKACDFAGGDGRLSRREAALYLAHLDAVPLSKLLKPGQTSLDLDQIATIMEDRIDDLEDEFGPLPWKCSDIDRRLSVAEDEKSPTWREIEGVTKPHAFPNGVTAGPFRLRATMDDVYIDKLAEAKGATLGFANNRLESGSGSLNTSGVFAYILDFHKFSKNNALIEFKSAPALEWNVAGKESEGGQEVEEIGLNLPATFFVSPGRGDYPALWILGGMPYFQGDFSGGHRVFGAEVSLEYVGNPFGNGFAIGSYQNIPNAGGWQYQLRLIPKADLSETDAIGPHSARTIDDDWFRIGGKTSFDIRSPEDALIPISLGASYEMLDAVSGEGGFSDLLKLRATLILNEHAGLTLEYSVGDTPVADQEIDLITLGLELKL